MAFLPTSIYEMACSSPSSEESNGMMRYRYLCVRSDTEIETAISFKCSLILPTVLPTCILPPYQATGPTVVAASGTNPRDFFR